MAPQLKPFAVIRAHTTRAGFPLQTVALTKAQRPPLEHLELWVGGGFTSITQVVETLHAIATELQSGNGHVPDMESVP